MIDPTCTGAWIQTFTGKKFHLLDPQPEEIMIEDIAHALSNMCRYGGHVKRFYSVAEHSTNASEICPEYPFEALMHDASEAYIADVVRPLKKLTPVGPPYLEVEDRIMRVIASKFNFSWPIHPEVHEADNVMLFAEKDQLLTPMSWGDDMSTNEVRPTPKRSFIRKLDCFPPYTAEGYFIKRFLEIRTR